MTNSPEYRAWQQLKNRCLNKKDSHYPSWGGRGIKFCDRWASFEAFFADMGPRPTPAHSLDRRDNNGNYEPGNCRWATRRTQSNNVSTNVYLEWNGLRLTISQWAERVGLKYTTLNERIRRGVPLEKALTWSADRSGPERLKSRAKVIGINYATVMNRIHTGGWTEEKALNTPLTRKAKAL